MIELINRIGQAWWSWMWPMFWQVGALIVFVGAVDIVMRRRVWPQVRYALWLLVLVKLVLPPTFSLSTSITSPLQPLAEQVLVWQKDLNEVSAAKSLKYDAIVKIPQVNASVEPVGSSPEPRQANTAAPAAKAITPDIVAATDATRPSWQVYLMLVWLLGGLALAAWLMVKFRQFRGAHRGKPDGADLPAWFGELLVETAGKLNLRRVPEVIFSEAILCPGRLMDAWHLYGAAAHLLVQPTFVAGSAKVAALKRALL